MSKKLKVGIIGLGGIANLHAEGWKESEHAKLVMGCDVNPELFRRWKKDHGIKKLVTDYRELIENPELDIIDVCSPNKFHAEHTIAALNAGKHVLCEKPLATTTEEILQMIKARDDSSKLLMTGHHFRFSGTARALKAEIDSGALGEIYHVRAWWLRRSGVPVRPSFIYKSQAFAGVGIDLGVHVLDLATWFMGNPQPVAVSGVARIELARQHGAFSKWGGDIPPGIDVDEFSSAFIRFDNSASMIIEVSWMLHHGMDDDDVQTWLYGTKAGAHWPRCEIYETNVTLKQHYNRALRLTQDRLRPHYQEIVEFAQAIVEGKPSPIPAEQSLQVQQILEAIYRSQETKREVIIDPIS
jgi:predicted dehydrogenase